MASSKPIDSSVAAAMAFACGASLQEIVLPEAAISDLVTASDFNSGNKAPVGFLKGIRTARVFSLGGDDAMKSRAWSAALSESSAGERHEGLTKAVRASEERFDDLAVSARFLTAEIGVLTLLLAVCAARIAPFHSLFAIAAGFAALAITSGARAVQPWSMPKRAKAIDAFAILSAAMPMEQAVGSAFLRIGRPHSALSTPAGVMDLALILRLDPADAALLANDASGTGAHDLASRFSRQARRDLALWRWVIKAAGAGGIVLLLLLAAAR